MNESTVTVSLTLAQRELILDAIAMWRETSEFRDFTAYEPIADELEAMLGAIPTE